MPVNANELHCNQIKGHVLNLSTEVSQKMNATAVHSLVPLFSSEPAILLSLESSFWQV